MKFGAKIWTCAIGATLVAACQQGAVPANNGSGAADNGANTQASAPAPAAAANTAAPAPQTGPVALASDSALPAPCQTVVRRVQTCIDHLSGDEKAFREDWLRTSLNSSRQTWASAYDDSYRGPVCEQDLGTLRSRTATWNCGVR